MSNDQSSSSKRKLKFSIDPVRVSSQDQASVKRVLGRLSGRVPFPEDAGDPAALPGADAAPRSDTAPGGETAPGNLSTPGSESAPGSEDALRNDTSAQNQPTPRTKSTPGRKDAPRSTSAPGRQDTPGISHAGGLPVKVADISPRRDFTKTPNSILRDVLSRGLFRGKSRDLYDFLYSKTRGAIVPRVSATLTTREIMSSASIGSDHTLRDNLRHLKQVGLVECKVNSGAQGGNEYFVYLPEEVSLPFDREGNPLQVSSPPQPSSPGHPGQKLPLPPGAETAGGAPGSTFADSTTYAGAKTSFKTKEEKLDDEALAGFVAAMKKTVRELTGKDLSPSEAARWGELADVLVTELKIAAGRTTVSSVPAFLAEHLRRRLWKKEKRQIDAEAASEGMQAPATAIAGDVSKCPDCFGTGMWYPEGFERGVARCAHEKLKGEGE